MTTTESSPLLDLEAFTSLCFSYDAEYDIAHFHVGAPRGGVAEDIGRGWYLFLTEDEDEVVGLEIHGLKRTLEHSVFLKRTFASALAELERTTGKHFLAEGGEDVRVDGSTEQLPCSARFMTLLLGQAVAMYEATLRAGGYTTWDAFFAAHGEQAPA
jgi:hypothetical protein